MEVKVLHAGISDHTAQLCTLTLFAQKPQNTSSYKRHFNQNNLFSLKALLKQETWENVYRMDQVNDAYTTFINTLTEAMNKTCPLVKTRERLRKPFKKYDAEAEELRQSFLQAQDLYLMIGSEKNKIEMAERKKTYDLKLKDLRRQATANYIERSDSKNRALWSVINNERTPAIKNTMPVELDINGARIQDSKIIAHHLNSSFINAANDILKNNRQSLAIHHVNTYKEQQIIKFYLLPTNEQEITQVINSLKNKSSAGVDDISAKLLKVCKEELITPLKHIINQSFSQGVFPKGLKIAKVFPKYKKGSHFDTSNYRPISLIPTFSKVIEKIVLSRLLQHLSDNHHLSQYQHGFLSGKSTVSAITNMTEFLIDSLESGNTSSAIFLDFSKAFDCLDHTQLIHKMKRMGICGTAGNWFQSYLQERSQVVEFKDTKKGITRTARSRPLPIKRGVPQGSVLGPILFILYTNDLPEYLQLYNTTCMYADDTVLLLSEKEPETLEVNSYTALNMAIQYCNENSLVINKEKTQQLVFGSKRDRVGRLPEIEGPEQTKYLGVTMDEKLTWTPHIDNLCSKLSSALYVIRRIKNISSLHTAKTAYHSLFESHLRYGLRVWGNSSAHNIQRVLIQQKKVIRLLAGLNYRDSCRQKFKDLKILTVVCLYILEVTTYASTLQLQRGSDTHNHNTRYARNFTLPAHHLSIYEEKPSYAGAKYLNLLPDEIKGCTTRNTRQQLTAWLLERPFYTIEEFTNWRTFRLQE